MSECFSREVESLTGTAYDMIFLYYSRNEHDDGQSHPTVLFECLGPVHPDHGRLVEPSSTDYTWMEIKEVEDYNIAKAGGVQYGFWTLLRAGEDVFSEHGLRPWEVPGWFKRTTWEAKFTLANLDYMVMSPFEQYKISPACAVLRVSTNKGPIYLKASTKKEGSAVLWASKFAPYLVQKPLHINVENEWFLMEEYGQTLDDKFSLPDYENIEVLYAHLQLESVDYIPELLRAGVPQQNVEVILGRTKRMLEDDRVRDMLGAIGEFAPVRADGKADLRKHYEAVELFLKHIYDEPRVPLTITHRDLCPSNIVKLDMQAKDKGRYALINWGCVTIDIPFSDVPQVLNDFLVPEEKEEVHMGPYLKLWAKYASTPELYELYEWVSKKETWLYVLDSYEDSRSKSKEIFSNTSVSELLQSVLEWILVFNRSRAATANPLIDTIRKLRDSD